MDIVKRFLDYVSYETTSDEDSTSFPSNPKELILLNHLKDQLKEMGVETTFKDGYVYGKLKSDINKKDTLFLMSHVDTSPEASGKDIKTRIVHYDGKPIVLGNGKVLDEAIFPSLQYHHNADLIVTDGSTLLGADDKAGVALIMDLLERAIQRGNYPNITVCFTPDEEIGRGTEKIDVPFIKKGTNKIYAYTVDGEDIRGFSQENFNAAHAHVTFIGTSVHPSIGKGVLQNAQQIAIEFHESLPKCRPENTSGRDPFIHLVSTKGSVALTTYDYILRGFKREEIQEFKDAFYQVENNLNLKYQREAVKVEINDSYFNMQDVLKDSPYIVEFARKAFDKTGITFVDSPIRGGTDGALLSYLGIPCPNLGTGGSNFHGVFEYEDIDQMHLMQKLLMNLLDLVD